MTPDCIASRAASFDTRASSARHPSAVRGGYAEGDEEIAVHQWWMVWWWSLAGLRTAAAADR